MSVAAAASKAEGMGAIPLEEGVAFRVWAPHADAVAVVGEFNDWDPARDELDAEDGGYWYGYSADARPGHKYQFRIRNGEDEFNRIDPYAREVTNSVGDGVIYRDEFDWEGDAFEAAPLNELVIYEMHIGVFNRGDDEDRPGTFDQAIERLGHLKQLGVNALEIMPAAEFAGDISWGYNPAHIFAVEGAYGGPDALKRFVKEAHRAGLAVILDVVYNHFGPSDLSLWRFDGWSENDKGGIYFYNDWKSETPWGDTRPDYGRAEVRQYVRDNALMWLEEFHIDGLRMDMTLFMRSVDGGNADLPEGRSLIQWINSEVRERFPHKLTIAEDLRDDAWLTQPAEMGGGGFSAQWHARFVHPVRESIEVVQDEWRSMEDVKNALLGRFNGDPFERVIYSESHDETANGRQRPVSEIDGENPHSPHSMKRAALGAGLVLTAPGIPMLFNGQEFAEDGWFDDNEPLDWSKAERYSGMVQLYSDLVHLRLNRNGETRGLTGSNIDVYRVDEEAKVVAFHRWYDGGPKDSVVVVANFANSYYESFDVGMPAEGVWKLLFNSNWKGYGDQMDGQAAADVEARCGERDGMNAYATLSLPSYGLLIYSRS